MLKSVYIIIILTLNLTHFSLAQEDILRKVDNKFKEYQDNYLQEKLYLHIDKSVYFTGETIWYKTYLLDAYRHIPKTLSKIIYIELLNADNQIIIKQTLKTYDGLQGSDMFLPDTLKSDYYKIRAYTKWMLNFDWNFIFEKEILIIQNQQIPQVPQNQYNNQTSSVIKDTLLKLIIDQTNPEFVNLKFQNNSTEKNIYLFIMVDGAIQYTKKINIESALTETQIPSNDLPYGILNFVVFDDSLHLITESYCFHSIRPREYVKVKTSQEVYKPREKITIDIALNDELDQPVDGNLSLSVSSLNPIYESENIANYLYIYSNLKYPWLVEKVINQKNSITMLNVGRFDWEKIVNGVFPIIHYPVEKNIPTQIEHLKITDLNIFQNQKVNNLLKINNEELLSYIKTKSINQKIFEDYEVFKHKNQQFKYEELPSDFSINLTNYIKFSSMKELFREVITMIKITGKDENTEARILNADNGRNKFFLKGNPLLIIDDIIVPQMNDILDLSPNEVESISIVWRYETLNKIQLGSLSNYGIIMVKTQNSSLQNKKNGLHTPIWQGFHKPKLFPIYDPKNQNISENPDFRNQIYWDPKIITKNGKAKISFFHSDDLGNFQIQIEGISYDGKPIVAKKKYQVSFGK